MQERPYIHTPARVIKVINKGDAIVGEYLRERESNQIIGMTKEIGHFLLSLNNYYVLSAWHNCWMYDDISVRISFFIYFNLQ